MSEHVFTLQDLHYDYRLDEQVVKALSGVSLEEKGPREGSRGPLRIDEGW